MPSLPPRLGTSTLERRPTFGAKESRGAARAGEAGIVEVPTAGPRAASICTGAEEYDPKIALDAYLGVGKDLEDALARLDRAVILGTITLPDYFARRDSIVAWLSERGVSVRPPEHSDTTAN